MTQPTPTRDEAPDVLAKQVTAAASNMCEIARIASEWRNGPKQSLTAIREIRAVLASAPAPTRGGVDAVAVKALEWVHDGEHYRADAGFEIRYSVFRRLDGWFDAVLLGTAIGHGYLSAETAKEACQADYEHRIRSALSPAATPVEAGGEDSNDWYSSVQLEEIARQTAERDQLLKQLDHCASKPMRNLETFPMICEQAARTIRALAKPASSPAVGDVREARARAIYEAMGFAYEGRSIGSRGPFGEWATALKAADAIDAITQSDTTAAGQS